MVDAVRHPVDSVEAPPPSQAEGRQCCCSDSVRQDCNTCGTKRNTKWEHARVVFHSEKGQQSRPKKGQRVWGKQWLKWSSMRGTGTSPPTSTGRECTGSWGGWRQKAPESHEGDAWRTLGGGVDGSANWSKADQRAVAWHYNWYATLQLWNNCRIIE